MQVPYARRILRLALSLGLAVVFTGGCPVIASADTPQDLEVATTCDSSKEPNDPYNYNVCVDETGIPSQFLPRSTVIVGAQWVGPQLAPALSGDHAQTTWGTDGNAYVALDDGLSGIATGHVIVKATGTPPNLTWSLVHSSDPVGAYPTISGGYYMEGLTSVHGVLYATRMPYQWGLPLNSAPYFANTLYPYGIDGIAYSTDNGQTWTLPPTDGNGYTLPAYRFGPDTDVNGNVIKAPANLNFVQFGQDGGTGGSLTGNVNPNDGWVYAIFQDRERNADNIYLGAVYPDTSADVVDPTKWEWYKGGGQWSPTGAYNISQAQPLISWAGTQTLDDSGGHFSYPEIHYDKAINRYLLTFTYAYDTRASCDPAPPSDCSTYDSSAPGYANDGGELIIMDAPALTGPYSFVARVKYFGPGNGYSVGIPPIWQGAVSGSYQDIWLKWSGNYAGCTGSGVGHQVQTKVDCSYANYYGYDMRELRLTLAGGTGAVVNPGFESGALAPWVAVGNGSVQSSIVRSGSYAVQMTGQGGQWVEQTLSGLTPGHLYTLTGYGMVSGDGSVRIGVYKYASGGASTATNSAQITASTFTAATVQFTPAGQTATIYCWRDTGTSGTSYCDDLAVGQGGGPSVVNPGFETGALDPWVSVDGGTVSVVTGQANTGTYALSMSGTTYPFVEQTISGLVAGQTYTVHGFGKVSGGATVRIGVWQYNGSAQANSAQITSAGYTEGTASFVPSGTTATIYCWMDTSSAGTAYCDDFSISSP